jgi:hypothetical protein
MRSLFNWLQAAGAWRLSPFSLPSPHAAGTPELREWCRLAGGLALLLSRTSPADLEQKYAASVRLYDLARRSLSRGQGVPADPPLLKLVLLEIEAAADPGTRASARLVLSSWRRRGEKERAGRESQQKDARRREGPASSQQSTRGADFDTAQTQLLHEVFDARANALRKTVAGARTTTTGFDAP